MSITIASPGSITRSLTMWCGMAPLAAEPTITSWMASCPQEISRRSRSRPTSRSVRPAQARPDSSRSTPSTAAPAARRASCSPESLHRAELLEQHTGGHELGARRGLQRQGVAGPGLVGDSDAARAAPPQEITGQRERIGAVVPRHHLAARHGRRLEAGRDDHRIAVQRHDRERQPRRDRRVQIGQPAVVGGRADDDGIEAGDGHPLPQPAEPRGDQSPRAALTIRSCSRSCTIG